MGDAVLSAGGGDEGVTGCASTQEDYYRRLLQGGSALLIRLQSVL